MMLCRGSLAPRDMSLILGEILCAGDENLCSLVMHAGVPISKAHPGGVFVLACASEALGSRNHKLSPLAPVTWDQDLGSYAWSKEECLPLSKLHENAENGMSGMKRSEHGFLNFSFSKRKRPMEL